MRRCGRGWRCAAVFAGLMSAALVRGEAAELRAQETAEDGVVVYGRADYEWTIRPLDGEPVELEAFRGKVLFINLWASWCTPCIREMETIERLKRRLADTDVEFLIVAAEGERPVRRHLRKYRYDLPIYLEVDRIPEAFGVRGLPTSWLVDRAGRILVLRHGEAVWDTDEVEAFVRAVADG
jgi:thiol-disulfide isomerase/thioredoxin